MSRQTLDKKNERETSIWKSQRNVSQKERKTNAKSPRQEFVWIFETTRNPVWQNESEKEEELRDKVMSIDVAQIHTCWKSATWYLDFSLSSIRKPWKILNKIVQCIFKESSLVLKTRMAAVKVVRSGQTRCTFQWTSMPLMYWYEIWWRWLEDDLPDLICASKEKGSFSWNWKTVEKVSVYWEMMKSYIFAH